MRRSSCHPRWLASQPRTFWGWPASHPLVMWWPAPPLSVARRPPLALPLHTHTKRFLFLLLVDGLILCGYGRGRATGEREGETPWPRGGREPPQMWPARPHLGWLAATPRPSNGRAKYFILGVPLKFFLVC